MLDSGILTGVPRPGNSLSSSIDCVLKLSEIYAKVKFAGNA